MKDRIDPKRPSQGGPYPVLDLHLEEPAWPDLEPAMRAGRVFHTTQFNVAAVPGGMASGATSVMLRVDLPDGQTALIETSLTLFAQAARLIGIKYPNPRES